MIYILYLPKCCYRRGCRKIQLWTRRFWACMVSLKVEEAAPAHVCGRETAADYHLRLHQNLRDLHSICCPSLSSAYYYESDCSSWSFRAARTCSIGVATSSWRLLLTKLTRIQINVSSWLAFRPFSLYFCQNITEYIFSLSIKSSGIGNSSLKFYPS